MVNAQNGLLSSLDAAVLERWANCAALYREALSKINRSGVSSMIVKTPSGKQLQEHRANSNGLPSLQGGFTNGPPVGQLFLIQM